MVRSWLDREEAVPHLLENVAGTIIGVEMAWGLAGSFLSTEYQFIQATTQGTPQARFLKQYAGDVKNWRSVAFRAHGYFSSAATKSARIGQRTDAAADGDDDVEVVVFDEAVNLRGTMV